MIAVDTNILVYAHREELPLHVAALSRLVEIAESPEPWALPVFCLTEFIRVVTHPKLFDPPSTIDQGQEAVSGVLDSPSLVVLSPGRHFWPLLARIAQKADARGNLFHLAMIVALCREHGVREIISEDRDLARFEGISLHTLS